MRKVNIIHLSDIHFDNSENSNNLFKALIEDLTLMKAELEEYHLLIITGDCIDKGKVECFTKFKNNIDALRKECNLTSKKIMITTGNHDSNLKNLWLSSLLTTLNEEKATYEELILKVENNFGPFYEEYNNFVSNYIETKDGFGVKDISIINSQKVQLCNLRIIALNSSWSTTIHNKYGELTIGDSQLKKIKNIIGSSNKKNDFTILCMHHPLSWFKYVDRVKLEEFMEDVKVDFLFHGHIHTSNVENLNTVDINTHTFCTGISYQKTGEKSSKKSGMRYSVYQLNKDTKTMNVYIRSTNEKGKFVEDNLLYSNAQSGFFTVPLVSPYKCLLPFSSIDTLYQTSTVLSRENVERILNKEKLLFQLYCKMEEKINDTYINAKKKEFEGYKTKWKKQKKISKPKLSPNENKSCLLDFYDNNFGLYCFDVLMNLTALFFSSDKGARFLIRKYNKDNNEHVAYLADGAESENTDAIKDFPWKSGLIYQSYKSQAALLKSCNSKYYENGNSNKWKNSLTIAVDSCAALVNNESIPLISLNIAIDTNKNEACLEALALSSIYEKISEIFKLYNDKVYDINKIIIREGK